MNPFKESTTCELVANESGQMAIFVALVFQVLFVFFAMVVNIGLVVHDKINLQNAVDLGAYYAAQQQAMQMNEIAHINYQLRQDYKLLAWRLRALGMMARANHPLAGNNFSISQEDIAADIPGSGSSITEYPAVCVAHMGWEESFRKSNSENVCERAPSQAFVPNIPKLPVIFPLPSNFRIQSIINGYRARFEGRCRDIGPGNWAVAANMNFVYRVAGHRRKMMIQRLANNLSQSLAENGFKDQDGQDVYTGLKKTIEKNLTKSNLTGLVSVQGFNGLAEDACAAVENGFPAWIKEILITPVVMYVDTTGNSSGCGQIPKIIEDYPFFGTDGFDDTGILKVLAAAPGGLDPYHPARGFEKNPWCMTYVGVKAKASPRKPFLPVGTAINLEARAFAMPFGGRIGPWDRSGWPSGAAISSAGDPVDPLAVPRRNPNIFPDRNNTLYFPNYSRYPGDQLGMKSKSALVATYPSLIPPIRENRRLTIANYGHFPDIDTNGDPLAANPDSPAQTPLRVAEMAAISPDLFDTTYYSIEPNYYGNYFIKTLQQRGSTSPPPIGDLGSNKQISNLVGFNVASQISTTFEDGNAKVLPSTFWELRSPTHLLTSWYSDRVDSFDAFPEKFGQCTRQVGANEPATVGNCIVGGRTGYSVKLVNRDYLMFSGHQLGGTDSSKDKIKNPPENF